MSLLGIKGKSVLITGASRGIGFGIARGFAEAGADLSILADDEDVYEAARLLWADFGRPVRAIRCDITVPAEVADAMASFERLDVLINNAGLELITPLTDSSPEIDQRFRRIIDINVTGTWNVTRAALPLLPDGARIINTASIWARTAVAEFAAYIASKHAIVGLTRTFAMELGARGIAVNAVCPGWVKTVASLRSNKAMAERAGVSEEELLAGILAAQALPGFMEPDDVAGLYLFLAGNLGRNITGQAIGIDRGEFLG